MQDFVYFIFILSIFICILKICNFIGGTYNKPTPKIIYILDFFTHLFIIFWAIYLLSKN